MVSAKEAYLRRHNLSERRSSREAPCEEATSPTSPHSPRGRSRSFSKEELTVAQPGSGKDKSWAAKRKEHVLARATGQRAPPTDLDVSATALLFAAKLKLKAKTADGPGWKAKRKASFLATHRCGPVRQADVAFTAVLFAAKLRKRVAASAAEIPAAVTVGDAADAADAHGRPVSPRSPTPGGALPSPRGRTWTQKRKDSYLKRYGRERAESVAGTDVAVTAVKFAVKLKRRTEVAKEAGAAAAGGGAGAGAAAHAGPGRVPRVEVD